MIKHKMHFYRYMRVSAKGTDMIQRKSRTRIFKALCTIGVMGLVLPAIASPLNPSSQRPQNNAPQRNNPSQNSPRQSSPRQNTQRQAPQQSPPVHARREVVRTPNYVPRGNPQQTQMPRQTNPGQQSPPVRTRPPISNPRWPLNQGQNNPPIIQRQPTSRPQVFPGGGGRPGVQANPDVRNQRQFTRTPQGRHYDNGLQLRKGFQVTAAWQRPYFPHGHAHYPYYRPSYMQGSVYISPYAFFFGVNAPFLDPSHCSEYRPSIEFIDAPVYQGVNCIGFEDEHYENYLSRGDLESSEPGLNNAINELSETFQGGNIDSLITLIDPNVSIAVYLRGAYSYSMPSSDYVDLTRDAIQSTQNVQLNITDLHQRAPGVFSVSGTETYTALNGGYRKVYMSFVLQDFGGQWTLTQVGTAPDRIQNW